MTPNYGGTNPIYATIRGGGPNDSAPALSLPGYENTSNARYALGQKVQITGPAVQGPAGVFAGQDQKLWNTYYPTADGSYVRAFDLLGGGNANPNLSGGSSTDYGLASTIQAPTTAQQAPPQQQAVGGPNFDSLGGLLAPSLQVGGGQATAGTSWDPVAEGAKLQPIGNAGATPHGTPGMLNPSGGSYTPTQLPYMQGFFDPSGHAAPVSAQAQNAMTTTQQGALSSWYNDVLGIAPEDMAKQQTQNSPTTNLAAPNSFA
jgi:hypothetical protein